MISYIPTSSVTTPPDMVSQGWCESDTDFADDLKDIICENCWSPIVWRDGKRSKKNFMYADWMVLDFDSGPKLEDWIKKANAYEHLIGVTKSHGIREHDRFRVAIRFHSRIEKLEDYEHTMKRYIKKTGADQAGSDGARFFYPCLDIHSGRDFGKTLPWWPAPPKPSREELDEKAKIIAGQTRALPSHISRFISLGEVFGGGRNEACFVAANEMRRAGYAIEETTRLLHRSPFDRKDFKDSEIDNAIKSAYQR